MLVLIIRNCPVTIDETVFFLHPRPPSCANGRIISVRSHDNYKVRNTYAYISRWRDMSKGDREELEMVYAIRRESDESYV